MKEWIADYVKGCAICQQNKILTHCTKTPSVTFCGLPTYFFPYFSDPSPYFPSLPLVPLPQDCPIVLSWSLLSLSDHSQPR